jgi:hypothetical protein
MFISKSAQTIAIMTALAMTPLSAQGRVDSKGTARDINRQFKFEDGSYSFFHESHGDHPVQQLWHFVPVGMLTRDDARKLALSLVSKHFESYSAKQLTKAIQGFDISGSKDKGHWRIEIEDSMYSECWVHVDWSENYFVINILVAAVPL